MWLVETVWLCHMLCLASSKFVMVKTVFSQISAFTFFTYYITISRRTEAKYTRNIVIKRNNILNHHHVVCSVLYCAWIWQKDISKLSCWPWHTDSQMPPADGDLMKKSVLLQFSNKPSTFTMKIAQQKLFFHPRATGFHSYNPRPAHHTPEYVNH